MMFRNTRAALALLCLGFLCAVVEAGLVEASAQVPASPTAVVERFHAALIDNMKGGKVLGFDGRRAKLDPVVKATFDIAAMARISAGAAWQKMSEAERAEIIAAFSAWTTANYAGSFNAWDGESFATKDQSPDDGKGNVVVNTSLTPKNIPPVVFSYRLHKVDGAWKVFDIYLDGAVSQLAVRRGEFAAVLARGSTAELIAHMNRLAAAARKDG